MEDGEPTQNRRSRRSNVLLKATLEIPGASLPVVLRNLSQDGALVQADELPQPGMRVLFHRQGLSVPSRVAWAHCNHAGIEFEFPLFPGEMLRHIPPTPKKVPIPMKRRPGFAARPLTAAERMIIERWATAGVNSPGD